MKRLLHVCFISLAARNEVRIGDIVEVFEGALHGRNGTVKHIMRGALFIQSRDIQENSGYMCVQARQCKVRGGKRIAGPGGTGVLATPARNLATPNPYGPSNVLASPAHHGGGPIGAGSGPRGPSGYTGRLLTQHDKLLEGKKVDIRKGPYRGMRGTIKSATGTHVRVELEARMQTVTVSREHLSTKDGGIIAQAPRSAMGMGMGMGMAAPGGMTPAHWSSGVTATPAHYSAFGSATPLHPGMTPGRDVSKTPAYDPAWASTPAHPGFGDISTSFGANMSSGYGNTSQVNGPVPGSSIKDWIGLIVNTADGREGSVTSVTDSGKADIDDNGRIISVDINALSMAPIAQGDSIRILVGNSKGTIHTVEYINEDEIYVKSAGLQIYQKHECGKVKG